VFYNITCVFAGNSHSITLTNRELREINNLRDCMNKKGTFVDTNMHGNITIIDTAKIVYVSAIKI
jgi:hypothetical protein